MEINDLIKALEESEEYKSWSEKNKGFYIVHVFFMTDHPPQVGYYNEDIDKIITFDLGDEIVINPASEVFKEKKKIIKLDLDIIKIEKEKMIEIAKNFKDENYPTEIIDKEMVLLQEIDGKMVYNLTYFTKAFNTLNIKIDGETGEIISHDLSSLVSF